jgi:hypothetical protein
MLELYIWADRLRERTYLLGGRPPAQRPHDDARGVVTLSA